ncbi:PREDICTED: homeobox-containing protein 1-like isoform X1 [Poecilia mexicana]|uniref:homeobox-containing protein 1-like isoform X1 n=1 Tax=Poecilia mexicana TaxID=48701 RepID=UPI00072DE885|nr:PREDICTED: homeobox-containing protein 1-like isoform X1 [Poecilia mexicana]XP_014829299.1 PREDICTED: homeobox-containing protein 1-like isoform X1 [Poecilia mexicana]XP_014829308.1 PREDICTED: homeobox-containing protein 1-like isoform X1 [Poecilia mexicana]
MSDFSEEPRFTIEQIDLLQRLRRTGMTKQEILHALDTLDRLDREHGDKFGRRTSSSSSSSSTYLVAGANSSVAKTTATSFNNNATASATTTTTSSSVTCNGGEGGDHSSSSLVVAAAVASSTTSKISTATQTQFNNSGGGLSPSPSNSYDTSPPPGPPPPSAVLPSPVALVALSQNGRDSLAATPNGKLSPPRYPVNSAAASRAFGFEAAEEDLDVDDKVEELMRRDSSLVKEEIKAFLGNRRISQAVVAQVTGISQSRISHWLLQHGSDLSEQKKRAFYRWYILEKTTPGATLNMRPAPLPLEEMEWRQTPPPLATAPGTFRLRRGSRFTWRKECLAVMESYFNDNQYPDEAKREEIANACNAVIQKPGKKLSDLERVTSLKVYNWFANRRKEIKRRANIEATILESHGIDVQSPGGHSNSDDIDGNDFAEQACDLPYFDKRPLSRPFGLYRLEPTSPTQDDSAAHNEHQDPISLAVEMAAVNHTILALSRTGGVPNDIKTESLEDE